MLRLIFGSILLLAINAMSAGPAASDIRSRLNAPAPLDGYLAYLQGEGPRGTWTCDEIRSTYVDTIKTIWESQGPFYGVMYVQDPEPGIFDVAPALVVHDMGANYTAEILENEQKQIAQHITEGSMSPGNIPSHSLIFGAKVRLFQAYHVIFSGDAILFDMSSAPKCKD